MKYTIEVKKQAIKDLKSIQKSDSARILDKIRLLEDNLKGNVKKLTNFTPEYRLRVGNYRILFEIEEERIIIYRIKHRKEVYQ